MNIVTVADIHYLKYLTCHLASLGINGSMKYSMNIIVIHKDIPLAIQKKLGKMIRAPHQISWFEVSTESLQKINAPSEFNTCLPHYLRLLIPFVLQNSSQAIYLDADTIVLKDLHPLWSFDLEGNSVAAVQDYLPSISDAIENWKELDLRSDAPYFNSGVMLMNLENWRIKRISQQVLDICQKYSHFLFAQKKWPQYDQYGLNVILYNDWKKLDHKWNYGTDLPPAESNIIHFIGNGKMGLSTCHPHFAQIFNDIEKFSN